MRAFGCWCRVNNLNSETTADIRKSLAWQHFTSSNKWSSHIDSLSPSLFCCWRHSELRNVLRFLVIVAWTNGKWYITGYISIQVRDIDAWHQICKFAKSILEWNNHLSVGLSVCNICTIFRYRRGFIIVQLFRPWSKHNAFQTRLLYCAVWAIVIHTYESVYQLWIFIT